MAQYIDKDALVAEIERRRDFIYKRNPLLINSEYCIKEDNAILDFIDTLKVKKVDLELIVGWFDHIAQIADDRMTLTNQRMTDSHALDEIKCLARNSAEFIKTHYKRT